MSELSGQKTKKRRIPRACDYCHQRSIRCRPSLTGTGCQNCVEFDQPCTFDRPKKRRGAPRRSSQTRREAASGFAPDTEPTPAPSSQAQRPGPSQRPETALSEAGDAFQEVWNAPHVAAHATIVDLVELYFEIVYPIFPVFHQPSFVRRISRAEYTSDRSLFAVTMAVCALVSARVRDGAVFSQQWDLNGLQDPRPNVYYDQAVGQAKDITVTSNLNAPRSYAVLALAAIQEGKTRDMHEHLGRYHTILAMEGLHDEDNWPQDLGVVETEERRRLFWSIYTLDVFTSIVWGGVIRSRESQSNVSYPAEVDDDMFDDTGFPQQTSSARGVCWIAGRNFVIDLYRMIERIITQFPVRSRAQREILIDESLRPEASLSQELVRNTMAHMYAGLPECLKEIQPVTCKPKLDRFGFQAADNIATVQLLRMVLLSTTGGSIAERCAVTNEVVQAFLSIPSAYHHAISVPLLFHLGVIGQLLGTALGQPLSESDYSSIREVLLSMAQLLSIMECPHTSKGASERLRHQVARIDEYMASQRQSSGAQLKTSDTPATHVSAERFEDITYSAPSSTTLDDTLAPFYLPSELLGDFSNVFDFATMSQH